MDRALSQWARIRDEVRCRLRRGSWYPVLSAGSQAVVIDVRGMPLSVHQSYVELTFARPTRWSIVARSPDAVMMPESWGAWYAVCPACGAREPVRQVDGTMACTRCDQGFHIDWRSSAPRLDRQARPRSAPHAA